MNEKLILGLSFVGIFFPCLMELRKSQYIYRKVIVGDNLTPVMGTEANARDRSKDCLLQVVISHTKSAKSSLLHGKT